MHSRRKKTGDDVMMISAGRWTSVMNTDERRSRWMNETSEVLAERKTGPRRRRDNAYRKMEVGVKNQERRDGRRRTT